jgi:misacylated tRNA(Ala) deacylase
VHRADPEFGRSRLTELIYFADCYASEFDAEVLRAEGDRVYLDRTAFYPEGGGQPSDTGYLSSDSEMARVVRAKKESGDVAHILDGPVPQVGSKVHGVLDWDTRYAHMKYHTAQHLLSAYFLDRQGATTSGNQIWSSRARIDFDLPALTPEMIGGAEDQVNSWIDQGVPVKITMMRRSDALGRLDHRRTRIELLPRSIATLRIVEVEGIDAVACAGTHVRNTSELGRFEVTSSASKGKGRKRLQFVLG